jgi:hypothetical protein
MTLAMSICLNTSLIPITAFATPLVIPRAFDSRLADVRKRVNGSRNRLSGGTARTVEDEPFHSFSAYERENYRTQRMSTVLEDYTIRLSDIQVRLAFSLSCDVAVFLRSHRITFEGKPPI